MALNAVTGFQNLYVEPEPEKGGEGAINQQGIRYQKNSVLKRIRFFHGRK